MPTIPTWEDPVPKLSERYLNRIKLPEKGRIEVWDDSAPGLFVMVAPTGRKSFVVQYSDRGRKRKKTLGVFRGKGDDLNALSLADARQMALEHRERFSAKLAPRRAGVRTVGDLYRLWASSGAVAQSTLDRADSVIRKHILPRFEGSRPEEITPDDILDMMEDIGEPRPRGQGYPVAANRAKAYLSSILGWAGKKRYTTTNPCRVVDWKYPEEAKQRVYSRDEIAILWRDFLNHPSLSTAIFRLTLATVQRPGEVMAMRWDDLDDHDSSSLVWVIKNPKNKRRHHVPLGPLASQTLDEMRALSAGSPYVFPGRFDDRRPMSSYKKGMQTVRRRCSVKDFCPHDLRRTGSSWLETLGVNRSIIQQIINHTPVGATSHYVYSQGASPACREALGIWEKFLGDIVAET